MKYKRTKMLIASCMLAIGLQAQTQATCVVVETTEGTETVFLLTSNPRITYANDVVMLAADDDTVELSAAEVKKVYLDRRDGQTVRVEDTALRCCPQVQLRADRIDLSGLDAGSPVRLCSATGQLLQAKSALPDGTLSLPLSQYEGIIIVTTNHQSFKIIRK